MKLYCIGYDWLIMVLVWRCLYELLVLMGFMIIHCGELSYYLLLYIIYAKVSGNCPAEIFMIFCYSINAQHIKQEFKKHQKPQLWN